jgi:hypothetical protein
LYVGNTGVSTLYWDNVKLSTGATTVTRIVGLSGDLSFGNVQVGSSAARTLTISNSGNSALNVISIGYPAGFSGSWSGSVAAGGSQSVTVTFAPAAATAYSGNVTVNSDKTGGSNTIACSGTGTTAPVGILSNASFEADSNTDGIPDGWAVNFSYMRQSGERASDGVKSLKYNMTGTGTTHRRAYSPLVQVISGATYSGSVDSYYSSLTTEAGAYVMISYYNTVDGSGTQYFSGVLGRIPAVVGTWRTTVFSWSPPSGARSFKILLYVGNTGVSTLYWDNVKLKAN